MTRVLELLDWLSLEDAAVYLSRELGEEIRPTHIVRFGLGAILSLSLRFIYSGRAWLGELPDGHFEVDSSGDLALKFWSDQPDLIEGVWDIIPGCGSAEAELTTYLQKLSGGFVPDFLTVSGLVLASPDRSCWAKLVEVDVNATPADIITEDGVANGNESLRRFPSASVAIKWREVNRFPESSELVVRVDALIDFCKVMTAPSSAKDGDPIPQRIPAARAQESAILQKLSDLGYQPTALPPYQNGKACIAKARCKASLPYSNAVFNKAWGRLSSTQALRHQESNS